MNKAVLWKLSAGDIVFKYNCDVLATFGSLDNPEIVRDDILKKWWNIKNEQDLRHTLDWLEQEGHSEIYRQALKGKATEFQKFFIKEYGNTLKDVDLTAWDLGRYASLIRWGHHAGYITESEVWTYLNRTSRKLQSSYTSWEQFAEHYVLGRYFWNGKPKEEQELHFALEFLLENDKSPWKEIDWHTPLDSSDNEWHQGNPYYVELNKQGVDLMVTKQQYYRRMLREDPLNPFIYNAFAYFLENNMMDPDAALTYYKRSVMVDKKFNQGYRNIIKLIGTNPWRRSETQEIFELWTTSMPHYDEAFFKYADWLSYQQGEYDKAQKNYEKAIELNDSVYSYYVDYGYFLADIKHDYEHARRMYLKALEINSKGEQALINLQALREGLEAVVKFTNSPQYARYFGKVYPV